jgi:hypothetical protein
LPDGTVNQNYSQTLQASGGKSPYTWSKTVGDLPPGVTLAASGTISGKPTTAGTYTFTVKVEDSSTPTKQSATKQLSIKINPVVAAATCPFSGVNLCQGVAPPGGCSNAKCSQYVDSIKKYASGAATVNLLKALMFIESSCNVGATTGSSYGLMQLMPETANKYRQYCGVQVEITSSWLTNPANADRSICIAAQYVNRIAESKCGSSPRNIYAGYNGGTGVRGACDSSNDCAGEKSCSGEAVKMWECLYDIVGGQKVCNGDNCIFDPADPKKCGYNQTKQGATYMNYCVNNPSF